MEHHTGLIRVAAATPVLTVANPAANAIEIKKLIRQAQLEHCSIIVFPELALTGSTCGDLFCQEPLWRGQNNALADILETSREHNMVIVLGVFLRQESTLYSCSLVLQHGRILGAAPKMVTGSGAEHMESRWFSPGVSALRPDGTIRVLDQQVPFGSLLYEDKESGCLFGTIMDDDLFHPVGQGARLCRSGAQFLLASASDSEVVGGAEYRRILIRAESGRNQCGYVYAGAGISESTADSVCSGHHLIAENGAVLKENTRFQRNSHLTVTELDSQRILYERSRTHGIASPMPHSPRPPMIQRVTLEPLAMVPFDATLYRSYERFPFLPQGVDMNRRCEDIFNIQAASLAKRLQHTHARTAVVGISGGLDSTLALLVTTQACRLLHQPAHQIIAITMPGFGTTGKTYQNALTIMKLLGTQVREIPIRDAVTQHFSDIGQDSEKHDITYENAQARERTQILMDVANMENGLVVGTGDLSEEALGWCTYNGDHMSMYGVNCDVPKTLVRQVVRWVKDVKLSGFDEEKDFSSDNHQLASALQSILDTPISPELLPPSKEGEIAQITEDKVGPYELHDFFLFYAIRYGMPLDKLKMAAMQAFDGVFDEATVTKWLNVFIRRFFSQQFKRNCAPDGPKVGSVNLSQRGDWRMPADADPALWLQEAETSEE